MLNQYRKRTFCTPPHLFNCVFYIRFVLPFGVVCGTCMWHPHPIACTIGHFVLNAALMASQWQHCVWTVSFHTSINTQHKAWQVAKYCFLSLCMTQLGIQSSLSTLVASAEPTVPLYRHAPHLLKRKCNCVESPNL